MLLKRRKVDRKAIGTWRWALIVSVPYLVEGLIWGTICALFVISFYRKFERANAPQAIPMYIDLD